ncbi:hypothetical protein Tco_0616180 [Tanacetum coccineum]
MHDDFVTTVYPQVHESLKYTTEEHVHLENPLSSSRTLSSMKNLEDNFTFADQFINDKPTEEDPGKSNVETKVESMVTIPIHQASSSVPPLSTPFIDLTPPKPVSSTSQEPIFRATTETTTTTLPLPPPPQQQSTTDPAIASRVSALEQKTTDTRDAPSSSSKQKPDFQSTQPTDDILIPDDMHLSDSEDSGADHLLKIKTRPDWLKPIPEDETSETLEQDWVIPPNDLPEPKNN